MYKLRNTQEVFRLQKTEDLCWVYIKDELFYSTAVFVARGCLQTLVCVSVSA